MERSSSTVHDNLLSSNTSLASLKDNSEFSMLNDSQSNSSIYDSAVENSSALRSFNKNACANNNTNQSDLMASNLDSSSMSSLMNSSSSINDNSSMLNDSISSSNKSDSSASDTYRNGSSTDRDYHKFPQTMIKHMKQSESTDTNTSSQEEVDPKSQLANKTIFKTDNPNLSIIEINDVIDEEYAKLENSVLVIEEPNDKLSSTPARRSPSSVSLTASSSSTSGVSSDTSVEKRRKKTESLLQSSKQKLDISIAEASAHESAMRSGAGDAEHQNIGDCPDDEILKSQTNDSNVANSSGQLQTRREIKIYETIEEFEKNLPSTVTILDTPFGSKVYLVGTAHFSEESQDDVSYVIRNVRPDVVMVELCPSRIHILKLDERTLLEEAKNFNLAKIRGIIQAHGYINGVFFIMLLQLSAQIAKDLGMAPGGEFRRAFDEIQRLPGCMLHLGDRPIRITLHRALKALSLWQTIKLVGRLLTNDTISIDEVEECKQKDLLEKLMQEMAGEFPAFSDVFVTERDMFLCHSLQVASLPQPNVNGPARPVRVVGVVGIGHAKGIAKMWGRVDPEKIPEIMQIPPASLSTRICTTTLKYSIVGVVLFGAYKLLRPRLSGLF